MALPRSPVYNTRAEREAAIAAANTYVRSHLWALEDAAVNELYNEYLSAYGRMGQQLATTFRRYSPGETWSAQDAAFTRRTNELMEQVETELDRLSGTARDMAYRQAVRAYQGGYYGAAWTLDEGLRGFRVSTMPVLPVEAIRAALLMPYAGMTFDSRFLDARDEFVRLIRRSLIQSQISGDSIYKAQKRLAEALGIDISRRTKAARAANRGLFNRTEMIVRTEILRASNIGALAIYDDNADILEGWEWIATKDERTCPLCGPLDGKQYELKSDAPAPPLHPRCRCSVLPILIDAVFQDRIAGRRMLYQEWARARGVSVGMDGGALNMRGAPPPKSPSPAARAAAGAR